MQHVFVLNHDKKPLSPCKPERARKLLDAGRAAVYRMHPFTLIMNDQISAGPSPEFVLKFDPGSKTTGIAIVRNDKEGPVVVWGAELSHKGYMITVSLLKRKAIRRGRRNRNTRYRRPKFSAGIAATSARPAGWVAPSIRSRLKNMEAWFIKLFNLCPISSLATEVVRFDMQLMENAEISGVEYQQGELAGYEVREYLLEKFDHKCAYCKAKDCPLEIEHITPKSRGGSNRVANLTLACNSCNQRKGSQTAAEFGHPSVQALAKEPLKDAAAVNIIRWKIYEMLQCTGLPVEFGSGGRTKFNRIRQGYPKAHWIDAACVGESGASVYVPLSLKPLSINAVGRGGRQATRVNKYGFPIAKAKDKRKRANGFATGDVVRIDIPKGKWAGTHIGRVTAGSSREARVADVPRLSIPKAATVKVLQYNDGYRYG
ncbi:MAG TPA: RNA-guided endonuclease IscB [Pseudomonadales bacterium]|nr:RNA-guided endonuclease IscB [Pseudomonadales bacterium]